MPCFGHVLTIQISLSALDDVGRDLAGAAVDELAQLARAARRSRRGPPACTSGRGNRSGGEAERRLRALVSSSGAAPGDHAGWNERAGTRRFTAWNPFQAAFAVAANGPVEPPSAFDLLRRYAVAP